MERVNFWNNKLWQSWILKAFSSWPVTARNVQTSSYFGRGMAACRPESCGTWFSSTSFCSLIPATGTFWGDGGRSSSRALGTLMCSLLIGFAFRQSFCFGGLLLPSQHSGGRLGCSPGADLQIPPRPGISLLILCGQSALPKRASPERHGVKRVWWSPEGPLRRSAAAPCQGLSNVYLPIAESNYLFCWNLTCSSLLHGEINIVRIPFDITSQVLTTEKKLNEILTHTW